MPVPSPIQSPAIQRGADLLTELFKSTVRPYIEKIAQIETELVGLRQSTSEETMTAISNPAIRESRITGSGKNNQNSISFPSKTHRSADRSFQCHKAS